MKQTNGQEEQKYDILFKIRRKISRGKNAKGAMRNICTVYDIYLKNVLREHGPEDQEKIYSAVRRVAAAYDKRGSKSASVVSTIELDTAMNAAVHYPEKLDTVISLISGDNNGHRDGIGIWNGLDLAAEYNIPLGCLPLQFTRLVKFGNAYGSREEAGIPDDPFSRFYANVESKNPRALKALEDFVVDHGLMIRTNPVAVAKELGLESYLSSDQSHDIGVVSHLRSDSGSPRSGKHIYFGG